VTDHGTHDAETRSVDAGGRTTAEPTVQAGGAAVGVEDAPAPSEAFGALASEQRVAVLRALYRAERSGDPGQSFSSLQAAADADSSAGFAYHLRQLTGEFVRETEGGYVLTPAGRAAAAFVVAGPFGDGGADACPTCGSGRHDVDPFGGDAGRAS
jgi:hypothetical protein